VLQRTVGWVHAVDDVSFTIDRGTTLGLVGESGCGKSTTAHAISMLVRPSGGTVRLDGIDLSRLGRTELRRARAQFQILFQDPYSSLDPRMRVADLLAEPLRVHGVATGDAVARARELLPEVGLPADVMERYPHEFSGGQRQRIAIARALTLDPSFLICDEPVSSLDVSIQAQVINLFRDLQDRFGLAYLFIAHDLAIVRHVSTRIAVMYLGSLVETGDSDRVCRRPLHPYTQSLISAIPRANPLVERTRRRMVLNGDVPNPADPPAGCKFNTRCPYAQDRCRSERPPLVEAEPGHAVSCHFWPEIAAQRAAAVQ
jgi:oligopeptide/dipeptide ABC transporter ATP-binding protein